MVWLIVVGIIVLVVGGRLIGARLQAPTLVKLRGPVPQDEHWAARATATSTPTFSRVSWTHSFELVTPAVGEPHWEGRVFGAGGAYLVEITVPRTILGQHYTASDPVVAVVHLQNFRYRTHWAQRLILGKYPDNTAILARRRAILQLRRQFAGGGVTGMLRSIRPAHIAGALGAVAAVTIVLAAVFQPPPSRSSALSPDPGTQGVPASPSTFATSSGTSAPSGTATAAENDEPAADNSATFRNFTAQVTRVVRTRDLIKIHARVCVRRLPPDPQGDPTRISRDP